MFHFTFCGWICFICSRLTLSDVLIWMKGEDTCFPHFHTFSSTSKWGGDCEKESFLCLWKLSTLFQSLFVQSTTLHGKPSFVAFFFLHFLCFVQCNGNVWGTSWTSMLLFIELSWKGPITSQYVSTVKWGFEPTVDILHHILPLYPLHYTGSHWHTCTHIRMLKCDTGLCSHQGIKSKLWCYLCEPCKMHDFRS